MFAGWPEHKVCRYLSSYRVTPSSILLEVNPLRANSEHKFRLPRHSLRFLEEQVGIPFLSIAGVEGRNTCFEFQPVFYRGNLRRKIRREGGCASADVQLVAALSSKIALESLSLSAD
jgi:hypothetical protein